MDASVVPVNTRTRGDGVAHRFTEHEHDAQPEHRPNRRLTCIHTQTQAIDPPIDQSTNHSHPIPHQPQGENARMASFVGAIAIADLVKTTLGPKGMDKILQSVRACLRVPVRMCMDVWTCSCVRCDPTVPIHRSHQ